MDIETTGLEPEEHEITVLGCGDGYEVHTITGDEKEILGVLVDLLRRAGFVVGYNIAKFDGPFIVKRARVHSVDCGGVSVKTIDLYRHVRANFSLTRYTLTHAAAGLAGVSCGEDITGAEAARLSQCGELEKVEEHCARDVVRTYYLYRALVERRVLEEVELTPWLGRALKEVRAESRVRVKKHDVRVAVVRCSV